MAVMSCTSTEYIDVEKLDSVLVINAQMTTDEDVHTIHLSTSTRSSIREVKGASVKVSINDGPFINAQELDGQLGSSRKYLFYETLKAGDKVEIKAQKSGLSAAARFYIPDSPAIVDSELTCDVPHSSSDSFLDFGDSPSPAYQDENAPYAMDAWHLLKVRIKDIPSHKSYYRIKVGIEDCYEKDGKKTGFKNFIWVDSSSEPVLTAGISSSADLVSALENSNNYNTFTDDLFTDKEYTLKLYIPENTLYYSRQYNNTEYKMNEDGSYEVITKDAGEHTLFLTVSLHSISHGEYIYLKALGQNDLGFLFSEPVSIPSNVEGGLGYADASSSVEIKIPLETFVASSGSDDADNG